MFFKPLGWGFSPLGSNQDTGSLVYVLRDLFNTALTAGNVDGTNCEPGPGVRNAGANYAISSGALDLPGAGGGAFYWSLAAGQSDIVRTDGRIIEYTYSGTPTTGNGYWTMYEGATKRHGIYSIVSGGKFNLYSYEPVMNTFAYIRRQNEHENATHKVAVLEDSASARYFFSDDFYTQLAWIVPENPYTANFKFGSQGCTTDGTIDNFGVWDSDIGTLAEAAFFDNQPPTASTEYEATASGHIVPGCAFHLLSITAPNPLSGDLEIFLRYYDDDNYFSVNINNVGTVRYRSRIAGNNSDTTDATAVSAADEITMYIRLSEYQNNVNVRVGNSFAAGDVKYVRLPVNWDTLNEATVKYTATDYVVNRWRAWPLMSTRYDQINIGRTGLSFTVIGDSKADADAWVDTLRTSLEGLGNNQWWEWPGRIATGGWTVALAKAAIDSKLTTRQQMGMSPEHILINLGSNDLASLPAEAALKADYQYIIEALNAAYPDASIYLAKPVRLAGNPPESPVAACTTLWGWIDDLVALYSYVYAGIDETDLEGGDSYVTNLDDVTHYSAAGQTAVAGLWQTIMGY